jgi:hypothetical protein
LPRFRVMVRGDNAVIRVDEAPKRVGFFTTRAVDAECSEQAVSDVVSGLRKVLRESVTNHPDEVTLTVEEVALAPWWWRRFRRPMGLVFFPYDSTEDQGVGRGATD